VPAGQLASASSGTRAAAGHPGRLGREWGERHHYLVQLATAHHDRRGPLVVTTQFGGYQRERGLHPPVSH